MPGQTLSEIRSLLASAGLAPQHRFGQNFLTDLNLMRKVLAAAELSEADVVLEVGAGTGSLTEMLLESGARVIAVEIDRGLAGLLMRRLADQPRFALIQADALASKHTINPLVMARLREQSPGPGGERKLVANLPYQIATPLLMDLLYAEPRLDRMVCTIQKEVGQRLSATERDEEYGPISVIMQTLADVRLIAILPPTAFWPRPQVESIAVEIRPRPAEHVEVSDAPAFARFVQRAFRHRRKMLRSLVRDWDLLDALSVFRRAGVDPQARPEELSPAQWRAFFREAQQIAD